MKCINCGKELQGLQKKFCSRICTKQYYKNHDVEHHDSLQKEIHVLREFNCRQCCKTVFVSDPKDRRTIFCSATCEKKYWKHPPETRRRDSNRGMGKPMSLTNFKYHERRALQ